VLGLRLPDVGQREAMRVAAIMKRIGWAVVYTSGQLSSIYSKEQNARDLQVWHSGSRVIRVYANEDDV